MDKLKLNNTDLQINSALNRFELVLERGIAFVEFEKRGSTIFLLHTEVPEEMTGQGIASILVKKVFDHLIKEKSGVKYFCPYIKIWLKRHPDYLEKI